MKATQRYTKLICLTCLTLFSIKSFAAEPVPEREDKFTIAAGVTHNSVPYTAADSITEAVPLFDIQYGPLFAYNKNDEPVFGVELFRHKRVMLALAAVYGSLYLDNADISKDKTWVYYGIKDRDKATEVALIFDFYSKVGLVEIMVARDVSNTYDDFRSSISWSRPFPDTGKWTITPRMYGKYYSIKYNDFYYGVSAAEMDAGVDIAVDQGRGINGTPISENTANGNLGYRQLRPAYEAGNAGQFGVDISIDYNFTEHFKVQGYLGLEQLAGQVTSSVLVEDADIIKASLGIAYTF